MSEPAIMPWSDIMSAREEALFKGHHEVTIYGPFRITLYWEPHFDNNVLVKSFTVDHGLERHRFATLAEADAKLLELEAKLIIEIGKLALRIN